MSRPTELPPPGAPDVLYLVDLSGYVFRAYHAIGPLSSPTGEPTNAVFGTVNMLQKLVGERKPALLGVAMEGGNNFRAELDENYKAHRPPPPEDLRQQMIRCKEIVEAYRIPTLVAEGFEADDTIAAIATQAKAAGLFVVIASADKDLMQLVDDRCVMWDAMRDRVYGPPEVEAKFAVPPSQVRDLLALVGDSSDNVPGVPGVGAKTAAELLQQFGDIDALYARIDEVKRAKIRDSLIANRKDAELSRQLVTLREDAPVELDREQLHYDGGDIPRLRALFTELGFHRHAGALPKDDEVKPKQLEQIEASYAVALSEAEIVTLLDDARSAGAFGFVAHTTSGDAMRSSLVGVSIATAKGRASYVPLSHRLLGAPTQIGAARFVALAKALLEDPKLAKIGHDLGRADVVLRRLGVHLAGVRHDTMLAAYLLDPEAANDLASVALRDAGVELRGYDEIAPKQRGKAQPELDELTVDEVAAWCAAQADAILRLEERQAAKLAEAQVEPLFRELELPLASVLADLEESGVLVDRQVLGELEAIMTKELARLEGAAREACGHPELNLGSPKQLETILFDELGLKATKKTKTGRSTDAEALEAISDEHALPGLVLEHRAIAKLKGTYVDALPKLVHPETGRIHGHWRQAVAATGRISSEDPNLQNIPIRTELGRQIRRAFVAPEGAVFLSADYSQIELRVLAHLSHDPVMVEAFNTGQDVHVRTAMEVFGVKADEVTGDMRRKSKTVNFGVIYGMGEVALSKRLGIPRKEAADFIERYFERYEGVARFLRRTLEDARKSGEVRTLLGRLRVLKDLRSSDRMRRAQAERIAQNTPIQGTAADILKRAMVALREPVVPGARMVLTVHDELCFEVPAALAAEASTKVRAAMEGVVKLDVPLVVDVRWGKSWAEAH